MLKIGTKVKIKKGMYAGKVATITRMFYSSRLHTYHLDIDGEIQHWTTDEFTVLIE